MERDHCASIVHDKARTAVHALAESVANDASSLLSDIAERFDLTEAQVSRDPAQEGYQVSLRGEAQPDIPGLDTTRKLAHVELSSTPAVKISSGDCGDALERVQSLTLAALALDPLAEVEQPFGLEVGPDRDHRVEEVAVLSVRHLVFADAVSFGSGRVPV